MSSTRDTPSHQLDVGGNMCQNNLDVSYFSTASHMTVLRPNRPYIPTQEATPIYNRTYVSTQRPRRLQQRSLFHYLPISFRDRFDTPNLSTEDETWGDLFTHKNINTVRVWYTNPRGLGINPNGTKSHSTFQFLYRRSKADIVCLAETNLRWGSLRLNSRLNNRLKPFFRDYYSSSSYNRHANYGKNQRGGTCTLSLNHITSRTTLSGVDSTGLGRWSWIQVSGKGGLRTRIITAYRPCRSTSETGLTTVWDQHSRFLRDIGITTNPRERFDSDLRATLQEWIDNDIRIVLCIDANENVLDGPFSAMIDSIGLLNAHSTFRDIPLPATHDRGSLPISGMFVSPILHPTRLGILRHGVGIEGDHRNMFLDFDERNFLGDDLYIIPPPQQRRLQLHDSRTVTRFNSRCAKHLRCNNIHILATSILQQCSYPPSASLPLQMTNLDIQLGRAIASANKHCRHIRTGMIPFTPEFKRINDERRFWLLLIRRYHGRRISHTTIRRLATRVRIYQYNHIDLSELKHRLHQARRKYIEYTRRAKTARTAFLESLAAASAEAQNKPKSRILRRILHDEEQRCQNRSSQSIFKKTKRQNLDSIEVFHEGQWVEVTQPSQITEELRRMNDAKYSSTNDTPLMTPIYIDRIGYLGERDGAKAILNGTFTPPPDEDIATVQMLEAMFRPEDVSTLPTAITPLQYQEAWKRVKEGKSSSISGRHFGVYKAVCQDKYLLPIFTNAFNIPFVSGEPYERWSKFLSVMIPKASGSRQVDKLRSLVLGEADWNLGGRIHVNRGMMRQSELKNMLPAEHYGGRKHHRALDAVLNKRLVLDSIRLSRRPASILSTDAANCYDRMVHGYISLAAQRLGLPLSTISALLKPLQAAKYYIRTAFGDSNSYYGGARDVPYQGTGQGNSSSSPFWLIVSSPLILLMTQDGFCASFLTAITLTFVTLTMIMYVDDNDIFIMSHTAHPVQDILQKTQRCIRRWRDLLAVTGGVVRPNKCSWLLIDFGWRGGEFYYKPIAENPYEIFLEDDQMVPISIARKEPNEGVKGLGVILQATGCDVCEHEYLMTSVTDWILMITHSPLQTFLNLQALTTRIVKTIEYPLPTTCFSRAQCRQLELALYSKSLPRCGISTKLPLTMRYSPRCFYGLGLPEFDIRQGIFHTQEFIKHWGRSSQTAQQLQLDSELAQLHIGTKSWIFDYSYDDFGLLLDSCWMKTTWRFLSQYHFTIQAHHLKFSLPRDNDSFLMEKVRQQAISDNDLVRFNRCRMFLHVLTISDLTDAHGTHLVHGALNGRTLRSGLRRSSLSWPIQGRPIQSDWMVWEQYLRSCYLYDNGTRLVHSLGTWRSQTHQIWDWYFDIRTSFLYRKVNAVYHQYTLDHTRRTSRHTQGQWCRFVDVVHDVCHRFLHISSVSHATNQFALLQSTSYTYNDTTHPLSFTSIPLYNHNPYTAMITYSDNDSGFLLTQKLQQFSGILIGDGSYDRTTDIGAAAFILESHDHTSRVTNISLVPINTPELTRKHNDPYRCELFAILLGVRTISALETEYSCTFSPITISVDNDSALDMGVLYTSLVDPTTQHFDIISIIRSTIKTLRTSVSCQRVRGHLDDKYDILSLSRPEQLNVETDSLSKYGRVTFPSHPSLCPDLTIPGEIISIWHENFKIYHNFVSDMTRFCYTHRAAQYYTNKYQWTIHQFDTINWTAVHSALSMCSSSTKVWISKYSSGFLATGKMLARRDYWFDGTCPRCGISDEDTTHILRCAHAPSTQKVTQLLDDFTIWLRRNRTEPTLLHDIIELTRTWMLFPNMPLTTTCPPLQEQLQLGWFHFLQGRICTSITSWQQIYLDQLGLRRSAQSFTSRLVHHIWTKIIRELWLYRNSFAHGKDQSVRRARITDDLIREIRELYHSTDINSLLHHDRHLLEIPLVDLEQRHHHHLLAWRDSIEVAIRASASSIDASHDTAQQRIHPLPLPNPAIPTPPPILPTRRNSPHLTAAQLRIARRRHIHNEKLNHLRDEFNPPPPRPPTPPPVRALSPPQSPRQRTPPSSPSSPQSSHPPPQRDRRRPRRRRRLRISLTPRISTRHRSHTRARSPSTAPPSHHHNKENTKRRRLQGSWRPP